MELVPGAAGPLELRAEQRMQAAEPRNAGAGRPPDRQALAWPSAWPMAGSGLFEGPVEPAADLPALRAQLLQGRLAMLSAKDREQLITSPRLSSSSACKPVRPFAGFSLVPSQDDWLGLTGRIQNSQPMPVNVQLDIGSGALVAEPTAKQWVLLRARTTGNAFDMNLPLQVADLLAASRLDADQHGALLAASGLLYAAAGQQQASREITWVGGGATRASCCCCWPSAAGACCWPSCRCWWACCSARWCAWRCSGRCM
jgi:hypothetical protein